MSAELQIWTVFDRPAEFPDGYVAVLSLVDANGIAEPSVAIRSESLDELRGTLASQGLVMLSRDPCDDAKILEVWL